MTRRATFVGYCDDCDERVTTRYPSADHARIVAAAHHDCDRDHIEIVKAPEVGAA